MADKLKDYRIVVLSAEKLRNMTGRNEKGCIPFKAMKDFMAGQLFAFSKDDWKAVLTRYGDGVGDDLGLSTPGLRRILGIVGAPIV